MKSITKKYVKSFEQLKVSTISNLVDCLHESFVFIDPFNKIIGKKSFRKFLEKMFIKIKNPKFRILNILEEKNLTLIKWNFEYEISKKKINFDGVSELIIRQNLIYKHIDYWDSGRNVYSHLPIIGSVFKKIHN
ncbi:MAG: nuclear transport factor 2 family protein [Alphaproteobacteria bacterium]